MLSDPVLQLLEDAGLGPSSRLSLAGAKESFCLEFSELQDVPHEETTNPRGEHFAAMKLYDAPLVAERALEVFGGLEKAKTGYPGAAGGGGRGGGAAGGRGGSKGRPPNRGTTNQLPLPCCACPALPAVLRCAAQPSQPSLEPHEALQGC
jgi:hypothetical protein